MDVEEFYRFLDARLDEDEKRWVPGLIPLGRPDVTLLAKRMLAEVEMKRALLEEHLVALDGGCERCAVWSGPSGDANTTPWPCRTARLAASVYSSHPDYRPEWAPTPEEGA